MKFPIFRHEMAGITMKVFVNHIYLFDIQLSGTQIPDKYIVKQ